MMGCFGLFSMALGLLSVPFFCSGEAVLYFWEMGVCVPSGVQVSFFFDPVGMGFGCVLGLVVCQVLTYSMSYMSSEGNLKLFYGPLSVFVGSMYLLIFVPDLVIFFMAWDGLGISSFLLVVFYSSSMSAGAGLITILTNRFGDGCLLMGCFCLFSDFDLCFLNSGVGMSCMLFLVAAFSKSAQWPLSAWLPAAMAAPTPVSSLVHSSTLVTAGVFLCLRLEGSMSQIFVGSVWIPCVTLFLASVSACLSYDLKRIIAMSTLSHLSLMFVAFMVGELSLGMFHLISHAVFKALLFMCGGNAISYFNHSQDIRDMGGMITNLPLSSGGLFLSLSSLGGVPFTTGFFSKDLIMDSVSVSGMMVNEGLSWLVMSCVSLSVFYSGRVWWWLSVGSDNGACCESVEESVFLVSPLYILGVVSVFMGSWLEVSLNSSSPGGVGSSNCWWILGLMTLGLGFLGVLLNYSWFEKKDFHGLNNMCFMRSPYHLLSMSVLWSGLGYVKQVEHGWLEFIGPRGVSRGAWFLSAKVVSWEW